MTLDQLDVKSDALEALRAQWEAHTLAEVRGKVADAHSHAQKALTDTLEATPDGRPSVLQLNRSPSFRAGLARLDELWAWLAGPSEVSLEGAVRDARESFLAEASHLWFPIIPEDLRSRPDWPPTRAQVNQIRAAVIHGYDPRKLLEGPIGTARRNLKAALETAGRRSTPGKAQDQLLAAWATQATGSLSGSVRTLLIDSVEYADGEAGRALIHPDFLDDSPAFVATGA